ncbi:response regulator transcription factor [Corynebacterium kroppenstedtii]|uniref:response regulator transcription factor n=1 Tax=Corynebacterium kroppenstedtii TaxID=161879 RepID=UPI00290E7548|nr:response regulator transcription factor [Corynebacterium kroppenstedtii]
MGTNVVGTATDAHDLTHRIAASRADVALIDIEMPGIDGIQATADLTAHGHCRVIIVTTFGRPGYLQRALDAGARGFVVKDSPVDTLTSAIRDVYSGTTIIPLQLHDKVRAAGNNPLTPRERDVLREALTGATIASIASTLFLSAGTVRNHISRAIAKTHTTTRAEAATVARDAGWL